MCLFRGPPPTHGGFLLGFHGKGVPSQKHRPMIKQPLKQPLVATDTSSQAQMSISFLAPWVLPELGGYGESKGGKQQQVVTKSIRTVTTTDHVFGLNKEYIGLPSTKLYWGTDMPDPLIKRGSPALRSPVHQKGLHAHACPVVSGSMDWPTKVSKSNRICWLPLRWCKPNSD